MLKTYERLSVAITRVVLSAIFDVAFNPFSELLQITNESWEKRVTLQFFLTFIRVQESLIDLCF